MKAVRDTPRRSVLGRGEPKGQALTGAKLSGERIAAGQVSGQARRGAGGSGSVSGSSGQRTHLFFCNINRGFFGVPENRVPYKQRSALKLFPKHHLRRR